MATKAPLEAGCASVVDPGPKRRPVVGFSQNPSAALILGLQRSVGNAAVARQLARQRSSTVGRRQAGVVEVQRCGPTPCNCSDDERADYAAKHPEEHLHDHDAEAPKTAQTPPVRRHAAAYHAADGDHERVLAEVSEHSAPSVGVQRCEMHPMEVIEKGPRQSPSKQKPSAGLQRSPQKTRIAVVQKCAHQEEQIPFQRELIKDDSGSVIQGWPFSDGEEEESDKKSGGGVLDWIGEQGGAVVHAVSDAAGGAYDWTKKQGGAAVDAVSVGNRAVSAVVVSRQVPPPPPPPLLAPAPAFRPIADFGTMTLGEFHEYARSKPDWSTDPALPAAQRRSLFTTLEFARAGDPAPVGPCGDIPLHDIEASGLPPGTRETLRTYSRGKVATDTAAVPATNVFADAIRDGEALHRLEAALPKATLHHVMGTKAEGKAQFPALVTAGEIDNFASYVKRSRAYLEADNGADIESYLQMVTTDGVNPASFIGRLPHVHNYHRFLAPMLNQLVTNEADVSRAKPLLLILHTGSDHNGAFHRDDELRALVMHPRNLAIMAEGAATLEAAGDETTRIAQRQGQGRRIQQLMIAGHGGPRGMDLAGRPDQAGNIPASQGLDLDRNRARTEKFLRRLVRNVAAGPDARIVLNACLTAADEVAANLSPNPAVARNQIVNSLHNSPSLAARLQQLAPGRVVEGNVSSVPAGEYMSHDPVTGAPTGVLHQIIPSDPEATGSDRATYVELGQEAEGCMRAVVALWALDQPKCLARVNARRAKAVGAWDDRVIHTFYDIVAAQPNNVALMNRIANHAARGLSEFDLVAEQTPAGIGDLHNQFTPAEASSILTPLYPHAPAGGQLAMDQVWMIGTPARRANFLTGLDSFATTVDATPHLDLGWLAPSLPALLPVAAAGAPTRAQMKLALFARTDPAAQAFVRANAAATRRLNMPVGTTVPGLTGGDLTEDTVLRDLGLLGALPVVGVVGAPAPNVDLDGDGVADIYLESLTRQAMVTAGWLNVRSRPDASSARTETLPAGHRVDVIGETGPWFAIDQGGRVGFVRKALVRRLPVR